MNPSDPEIGATLNSILAASTGLSPSERRVAELCLTRPAEVAWWSVSEIAKYAGTSTATVIRASQNLGFTGYTHLRLLILRDLGGQTDVTDQTEEEEPRGSELLKSIYKSIASNLAGASAPLSRHEFDDAITALAQTDRILIVGNGTSGPAATLLAIRFVIDGRNVTQPTDAAIQRITASQLGPGDVCLAISHSGMTPMTLVAAETARSVGAIVIGVANNSRSHLMKVSHIPLVVGGGVSPWDGHGASAAVVQIAFLVGLQVAVTVHRGDNVGGSDRTLEEIGAVIDSNVQS